MGFFALSAVAQVAVGPLGPDLPEQGPVGNVVRSATTDEPEQIAIPIMRAWDKGSQVPNELRAF